jgi:peptidyl-prolyl cis-trans isomerase C
MMARYDRTIRAACMAACLTVTLAAPSLGQNAAAAPDASPFAPGDLKKPIFDTQTPVYHVGDVKTKSAKTVVAEVDGRAVTLGNVADAIAELPAAEQRLPFQDLFPRIRDQLVRRQALVIAAQRSGVDEDPSLQRKIQAVTDRIIADDYLRHEILGTITEQDLLDRYDRDYAGKPGPEEVHVRLIMLPTEQEAESAIGQLQKGADFATLARKISKDTTASIGGDLGWVTRNGINPALSAVVFALPPGQATQMPVSDVGSWFVLKVEDRRRAPTPAFSEVRAQLTEAILRDRVPQAMAKALVAVKVRDYDITGKENASDANGQ